MQTPSSSAPSLSGSTGSPTRGTMTFTSVLLSTVPCLVFLVIYGSNDHLRILPRASDIHCVTLYNVSALEVQLFSIAPHRFIASVHQSRVLDLLAALPYMLHYLIPFTFPIYLCVARHSDHVPCFFRLLGCSLWAHYAIWYMLPTAPPWVYDSLRATQAPASVDPQRSKPDLVPLVGSLEHREGCAFARLDAWTGISLFYTIFNGNPVPFASFPSGHVAWPMCVLMSLPAGTGRRRRSAVVMYIAWVSWATMHSCHHYLLDIVSAIGVTLLCQRLMMALSRWTNNSFSIIRLRRPARQPEQQHLTRCCCPPTVVVVVH